MIALGSRGDVQPYVALGKGLKGAGHEVRVVSTVSLVLQALARTEQRAILLSGWGGLRQGDLPETVYVADVIPPWEND